VGKCSRVSWRCTFANLSSWWLYQDSLKPPIVKKTYTMETAQHHKSRFIHNRWLNIHTHTALNTAEEKWKKRHCRASCKGEKAWTM